MFLDTPMLENVNEPVQDVKHSNLERSSPNSPYRSHCPVCEDGVLLVGRDLDTFELKELDICVCCGQHFRYTDIEEMRNTLG